MASFRDSLKKTKAGRAGASHSDPSQASGRSKPDTVPVQTNPATDLMGLKWRGEPAGLDELAELARILDSTNSASAANPIYPASAAGVTNSTSVVGSDPLVNPTAIPTGQDAPSGVIPSPAGAVTPPTALSLVADKNNPAVLAERLNGQVANATAKYVELNRMLSEISGSAAELLAKVKTLTEENVALREENASLSRDAQNLETRAKSAEAKLKQTQADLENTKKSLKVARERNATLTRQSAEIAAQFGDPYTAVDILAQAETLDDEIVQALKDMLASKGVQ